MTYFPIPENRILKNVVPTSQFPVSLVENPRILLVPLVLLQKKKKSALLRIQSYSRTSSRQNGCRVTVSTRYSHEVLSQGHQHH